MSVVVGVLFADVAPTTNGDVAAMFACVSLPFLLGFLILAVLHVRRNDSQNDPRKPDDNP